MLKPHLLRGLNTPTVKSRFGLTFVIFSVFSGGLGGLGAVHELCNKVAQLVNLLGLLWLLLEAGSVAGYEFESSRFHCNTD